MPCYVERYLGYVCVHLPYLNLGGLDNTQRPVVGATGANSRPVDWPV